MDFIQVSSDIIPKTKASYRALKVPVTCTLNPRLELILEKAKFPEGEIIRCLLCKAYINKYCEVNKNEYNWRCNLCSHINRITFMYHSLLSKTRVELMNENFEIYADENYMIRPPMAPFFMFLVNISSKNAETGFLNIICDTVAQIIESYEFNERTLCCFLLFDEALHFVKISSNPEIISIDASEESNFWLPFPLENFVVNLYENRENVKKAVEVIRKLYGSESACIRKALEACLEIMRNYGGKVLAFLCECYMEAGHLKELVLTPTNDFYTELSHRFIDAVISVDFFLTSLAYMGIVNIGELARKTSGDIYYYLEISENTRKLIFQDICKSVTKLRGWEAAVRLRTSTDWRIANFFGHFTLKEELLVIPDLGDSSYTFELYPKYEIPSNAYLYLQASILYTTSDGVRMIRVFNTKNLLSDSYANVLESINCDVLYNYYIKQAISIILKRNLLLSAHKYFEFRCSEIVKVCLEFLGKLPENLESCIIKTLGIMKHPVFINNNLPYSQILDYFQYLRFKSETLSVEQSAIWTYPRLYKKGNELSRLSSEFVMKDEYYVLDNGIEIVVFIDVLEEILTENGEFTGQLKEKLEALYYSGGIFQPVMVVYEDSNLDKMYCSFRYFWRKLIEDKGILAYTYEDFYKKMMKTAREND